MIAAVVVFAYLAIVLYIGIFAFRSGRRGAEDYFLAGRSLGPAVFLLSLVGTNMTAFSILGASGHAFANGIVTFGLMGSSSALVIPVCLLFIGTRLWAVGRRHGFITPVQMFRDRWECGHIGTFIFAVQAVLLVPYIVIAVIGGGTTLQTVSGGLVPYWVGGAVVSLVVMSYVFLGGMRGTAWVNAFQTVLFLLFGAIAVSVVSAGMGGFSAAMAAMLASPDTAPLLTRERVSPWYFFSYTFIPLSSIAFPHMAIFCMTARRLGQFRKTIILYPLCILAIWLPSVFLGVAAHQATTVPGDNVILRLVATYAPVWLAAGLGAMVMAAVMASDSQILALSTMFTEDVFTYYGGTRRFGDAVQVRTGRIFVIVLTIAAYGIALRLPASIFDLMTQYAFAGFSALVPLLVAALFWQRSTRWGALAVTAWTAAAVAAVAVLQTVVPPPPPGLPVTILAAGGVDIITRAANGAMVFGMLPVVAMTVVSAFLMVTVSLLTPAARPAAATLARYFVADAARQPSRT
jgi:SSS family solute:Na+ symporter